MDYINRMPAIISLSASILIGFCSYFTRVEDSKIYIILCISLVVFYIVGLIIRSNIRQILDQVAEAKRQKLKEEKRLEEEKRRQEEEINKRKTKEKTEAAANPSTIDYSVGGDDGFTPFQFEKDSIGK